VLTFFLDTTTSVTASGDDTCLAFLFLGAAPICTFWLEADGIITTEEASAVFFEAFIAKYDSRKR
jgi:hypothetical protein